MHKCARIDLVIYITALFAVKKKKEETKKEERKKEGALRLLSKKELFKSIRVHL